MIVQLIVFALLGMRACVQSPTHVNSWACGICLWSQCWGSGFLGFIDQPPWLTPIGTLQTSERLPRKAGWMAPEEWYPALTSMCAHTATHCAATYHYTHVHTKLQTQPHTHHTRKHATTYPLCIYTPITSALHLSLAKSSETQDETTKICTSN